MGCTWITISKRCIFSRSPWPRIQQPPAPLSTLLDDGSTSPLASVSNVGRRTPQARGLAAGWLYSSSPWLARVLLFHQKRKNLIKRDVDLIHWESSSWAPCPGSCPRQQREPGEEEGGGRKAGQHPFRGAGWVSLLACPKDGAVTKQLCPRVPLPNPALVFSTRKPHPGGRGEPDGCARSIRILHGALGETPAPAGPGSPGATVLGAARRGTPALCRRVAVAHPVPLWFSEVFKRGWLCAGESATSES